MENKIQITNLTQGKNLLTQFIKSSDRVIKTEKTGAFYAVNVQSKKKQYSIYCTSDKTTMETFISSVENKWHKGFDVKKENHPNWELFYKGLVSFGMSSIKEIGGLYVILWTVDANNDFTEVLDVFQGKTIADIDVESIYKKSSASFIFVPYLSGLLMIIASIILFGGGKAAYAIGRSGSGIEVPNFIVALIFLGISLFLFLKKYSRSILLFLMIPIMLGVFSLITGMDRSFFNNPKLLVQVGVISLATFIIVLIRPMDFGRTNWKDMFEK